MIRILAIVLPLLSPLPAWTQEPAAPPLGAEVGASAATARNAEETAAMIADGLEMPTEEVAPEDPVAVWEADPTAVLPADGIELSDFEYVARPLVIFADSPRQPEVEEQVRLLESDLRALADRDVVIILDTDPDARSEIRRELRPRGFGIVLVEKDGRVTFRRPAPMTVREISRAIDRSPIRQEETRYRQGAARE